MQPAEGRDAVEQPAPLGVGRYVTLNENRAFGRVDAAGQQQPGQRARLEAQLLRVLRHGQAVQVNHAEVVGLVRLLGCPLPDSARVVAQMDVARRLNTAEYDLFPGHVNLLIRQIRDTKYEIRVQRALFTHISYLAFRIYKVPASARATATSSALALLTLS